MAKLAEHWTTWFDVVSTDLTESTSPDDATIRRWAAATGRTQLASFLRLAEARWAARRARGTAAPTPDRAQNVYRRALRIAYRDPIELADLAVDGEDLQREGIARGPALGKFLRLLLEWVVAEPARNTRDQLIGRANNLAPDVEREIGDAKSQG